MNQQDYGMRIYDTRLGRFLSEDPLASQYPSWSPYPFAMNRPIDGIDLDGMEWQPVNGNGDVVSPTSKDIASYNWVGYNKDGTAKEGSVSGGVVNTSKGFAIYTSDSKTRSGEAYFLSKGNKEYREGDAMNPSGHMRYNISIKYRDRWQDEPNRRGTGGNTKYVDVAINGEGEDGDISIYSRSYADYVPASTFNSPTSFFNAARYSLGYVDSRTGEAISSDGLGPVDFFIGVGELKWGKGIRTLLNGGLPFAEYKLARGGGGLVGEIKLLAKHPYYGESFPNWIEYDHRFIKQWMQRKYNLPYWLVNNRLNVIKTTTIKHATKDAFRYRFLPKEIKLRIGPGGDLLHLTK